MPKEEWGVKRLCPACSTRFYDLRRNPMTCPACGNVISLEALLGNRAQSTVTPRKAVANPKPAVEADSEVVVDEEDDSGDGIEDDLLADDDDDDDKVDLDDIADVAADDDT